MSSKYVSTDSKTAPVTYLEGGIVDPDKLQKVATATVVGAVCEQFAVTPQPKEAWQITFTRIAEPLGLDEDDDVEDGVDDHKHPP